jgi:hypothetical protein
VIDRLDRAIKNCRWLAVRGIILGIDQSDRAKLPKYLAEALFFGDRYRETRAMLPDQTLDSLQDKSMAYILLNGFVRGTFLWLLLLIVYFKSTDSTYRLQSPTARQHCM